MSSTYGAGGSPGGELVETELTGAIAVYHAAERLEDDRKTLSRITRHLLDAFRFLSALWGH